MRTRTEYSIRVVYNPEPSEAVLEKLIRTAVEFRIPEEEIMQTELNVTLDEKGYSIWFITMLAMDPAFTLAPHFWSRGEPYVSRTGDTYHVEQGIILV